ncbi:MAG: septum formation initiator family protein [Candidatus Latescibacteria bacterium]|nr:septum formation initiator family protein [Candidatus Latescibacterota bacterium]
MATRDRRPPGSRLPVLIVFALVSLTTAYIWTKVQMAKTLRQVETAEARIRTLEEERDKLTAAISMNKKPGAIRERAQQELGMIDPGATQAKAANVHAH